MNSSSNDFFSKHGAEAQKLFNKHKADETVSPSGGNLPEGIEDGVAQLVDCYIKAHDKGDNKGKFFFYAGATVVSPERVGNRKVAGLRTSVTEPLYPTPTRTRKTLEDHLTHVMNYLRLLGIDTSALEFSDMKAAMKALEEQKPLISFRTWKGEKATEGKYKDKEPMVQHTWLGLAENVEIPPQGDFEIPPEEVPTEEPAGEPGDDLDQLVSECDHDEGAQATLKKRAIEAGFEASVVEDAQSWAEVADMIRSASQGTESETNEDTESHSEPGDEEPNQEPEDHEPEPTPVKAPPVKTPPPKPPVKAPPAKAPPVKTPPPKKEIIPKVEGVYNYFNPKTKKTIECEVTAVNSKSKTVTLKSLTDGKTVYANIPFSELKQ